MRKPKIFKNKERK